MRFRLRATGTDLIGPKWPEPLSANERAPRRVNVRIDSGGGSGRPGAALRRACMGNDVGRGAATVRRWCGVFVGAVGGDGSGRAATGRADNGRNAVDVRAVHGPRVAGSAVSPH